MTKQDFKVYEKVAKKYFPKNSILEFVYSDGLFAILVNTDNRFPPIRYEGNSFDDCLDQIAEYYES